MAQILYGTIFSLIVGSLAYPRYFDQVEWDDRAVDTGRIIESLDRVQQWSPDPSLHLGQVGGVATDSNENVLVFHRAERTWGFGTFNSDNTFAQKSLGPIQSDTIVTLDPNTGKKKAGLGANLFYLPHGLTVDNKDNIWVTDVALHQVMRFPKGANHSDLVLGHKFVPGNNASMFCKPTDVAVASNGDFFVADGYCNSRVMKFSADGTFQTSWGYYVDVAGRSRPMFRVPHGLALDESRDLICVADRENARVPCYKAGLKDQKETGSYVSTIIPRNAIGRVYGIEYDKTNDELVAVVDPSQNELNARGFTYSMTGDMLRAWGEKHADQSQPHDVTVSPDGDDVYLGEIGRVRNRVVKFVRPNEA